VVDGRAWIETVGPELAVQARLLAKLLAAVEGDAQWEWLELSCSVAEHRGDALSDLDLGLGYRGSEPPSVRGVTDMLTALGAVVEVSEQPWDECHRWWVQYTDGGQIDLVVMQADTRPGRAPGGVALLDRGGRLQQTFTPRAWAAAPEEPRRWLLDGWEALVNTAKYLHRGSLLEACSQIQRARERVFQLWAVGEGVAYPTFGLTSLLDAPHAKLPSRIEASFPTPDFKSVRASALALSDLLFEAGRHADARLDSPLREYVATKLRGATR